MIRIGREVGPEEPTFGTPGYGVNKWPRLPDSEFRTPVLDYRDHVLKLATRILTILAKGLPFNCDEAFKEFSSDPVGSVNLIHYPPREKDKVAALGGISIRDHS